MTATPPDGLLAWALDSMSDSGGATPAVRDIESVAGDASNRRYFRLRLADRTAIVVYAPPATEKNHEFVRVAGLFAAADVRVPEVLAADFGRGFLLLEDLGDELLLPGLTPDTADRDYARAGNILLQLAALQVDDAALPVYDERLLTEEVGRFEQWFVKGLLQYDLPGEELALWQAVATRLVASALEQPRVLVHRDFHSRNLMRLRDGALAVIDFQDAVSGPVTYDPVSLLRDCYIRWPAQQVRGWALAHRDALVAREILPPTTDATYLRWFDLMGLQRHLKVLGNFARLAVRDGRDAYLKDLPMVIAYILDVLDANADAEPGFADFAQWLRAALLPRAREQQWGSSL